MLENCCIDRVITSKKLILNEKRIKKQKEIALKKFEQGKLTKIQLLQEFALLNSKKWTKQVISVKFLDGSTYFKSIVKEVSKKWETYANIHFEYVFDYSDADIRISFLNPGSWSYIGTEALYIDQNKPTMNYGWFKITTPKNIVERTILHEFGHALGLIHEHQSPAAGINWNKSFIYKELSGTPNFWKKNDIIINIFKKYSGNITNSIFDPYSIMIYQIPTTWTTNGFHVDLNDELSPTDIDYISRVYP